MPLVACWLSRVAAHGFDFAACPKPAFFRAYLGSRPLPQRARRSARERPIISMFESSPLCQRKPFARQSLRDLSGNRPAAIDLLVRQLRQSLDRHFELYTTEALLRNPLGGYSGFLGGTYPTLLCVPFCVVGFGNDG